MTFKSAMFHNNGYPWMVPSGIRTIIPFAHVGHDFGGFRDAWQPSKLIIPAGFNAEGLSQARLTGQLIFELNPNGIRQGVIKKNYSAVPPLCDGFYDGVACHNQHAIYGTTTDFMMQTAWVDAVDGDFFQLEAYQDSGSDGYVLGGGVWFQIEVR
jgi:hypothetical protein